MNRDPEGFVAAVLENVFEHAGEEMAGDVIAMAVKHGVAVEVEVTAEMIAANAQMQEHGLEPGDPWTSVVPISVEAPADGRCIIREGRG